MSETNGLVDQLLVERELENAADAVDVVSKSDGFSVLRQFGPQIAEIIGAQVIDAAVEMVNQDLAGAEVILKRARRQLARVELAPFVVEERIAE